MSKKFKMPQNYRIVTQEKFDFNKSKSVICYWVEEYVVDPVKTCYWNDWVFRLIKLWRNNPEWIRHSSGWFYDKFEFSTKAKAEAYISYHSKKYEQK